MSRLLSGAKSLVKVKPVAPIEGDDVTAISSRIAYALQSGDLSKASAEWTGFSDAAKQVSQNWHSDLSARLTANSLLAQAVESFMVKPTPSE